MQRWLRKRRLAAAYRAVFGSPEGKLVLADLLRRGGILETSHVPGDACSTAFQEGRRAMALDIIAELRWSDGELVQLAQQRSVNPNQEEE
jgi:hypothetical protein